MISHLLDRCIAEFILLHHLSTKIQPPPLFSSLRIRQDDRARSNALFIKMEETTAQKLLQIHSLESLPTYWKTHTFKEINTWRNYTHTHTHTHSSGKWLVPQQLLLLLLGVPLELPLVSPRSSSSTSFRSSITSRLSQISPICLFMWAMVLCILLIFLCRAVAMALWLLCLASYSCLSCL